MELFPDYFFEEIEKPEIEFEDFSREGLGYVFPRRVYFLNRNDSPEEQVKSFLHELYHLHPKFVSYTGGLWQETIDRDEERESKIEAMAIEIFETRSDIVEIVRTKLQNAK